MRNFLLIAVAVVSLLGGVQGASVDVAAGITNGGHSDPPTT